MIRLKKILSIIGIVGMIGSTSLIPITTYAADWDTGTEVIIGKPTNDENKKVKLSTKSSDNCTSPENIQFAWYYSTNMYNTIEDVIDTTKTTLISDYAVGTVEDNKAIGTYTATYTANGNGYYYAVSKDEEGNLSYEVKEVEAWDIEKPTFDLNTQITIDPETPSKSVTITIPNATDNISLSETPYELSLEGTIVQAKTSNNAFVVTKNGTYTVSLYDYAGNKETKEVVINNVDTTAPVFNGVVYSNNSNAVNLTIAATDAGAPADSVMQYSLGSTYEKAFAPEEWQSTSSFSKYDGNTAIANTGMENEYYVGIKDTAGNITCSKIQVNSEYILGKLNALSAANLASYITKDPGTWTNESVIAKVNIPSGTTPDALKYSWNGGDYTNNNSTIVNSNGEIHVSVKDKYNNIYTSNNVTISTIDKTVPTINVDKNTNQNLFTITVGDIDSGLSKLTIRDKNTTTTNVVKDFSTTHPTESQTINYPVPANGTYEFIVYDMVGNSTTTECNITEAKIDRASELTGNEIAAAVSQYPATWTNGNITLTLSLSSIDGLASAPYKWTGTGITNPVYSSSNQVDVSANGDYYVTVKDKYGFEYTSNKINVNKIDKTNPTIETNYVDEETHNKIKIEVTDSQSKLDRITVQGGIYTEETTIKSFLLNPTSGNYTFNVPNKALYTFKVYDKVGNINQETKNVENAVTDNPYLTANKLLECMTYSPSAPTTAAKGGVTVRLDIPDMTGLDVNPYSWDNGNTSFSNINTHTVITDGAVTVTVKDIYGNTYTSDPLIISNIDSEIPTISAELNDEQNTFTIKSTDTKSGLSKITISGTGIPGEMVVVDYLTTAPKTECINTYTVPQKGDFVFKAYDVAGNTNVSSTITASNPKIGNESLSADNLKSKIVVTPTEWTKGNVTLTLAHDSIEGLAEAPYKWNNQTTFTTSNTITVSENGTYFVTVMDKYGATYTSGSVLVNIIDKVAPSIVTTLNNNKITITVGDANSTLDKVTVKGQGISGEETIKDYLFTKESDTFTYNVTANGNYTFTVYDHAGWTTSYTQNVAGAKTDNSDLVSAESIRNCISATPAYWTNENVELRVALGSEEGLATVPYKWSATNIYGTSKTCEVSENGKYTVTILDIYGNQFISNELEVTNIDKLLPTIDVTLNANHNKFNIVVQDPDEDNMDEYSPSGLQKVTIQKTDSEWNEIEGQPEYTVMDYLNTRPTGTETFSYEIPENGYYVFKVYDVAGNVNTFNKEVTEARIDNSELTSTNMLEKIIQTPTEWTNAGVVLSLNLVSTEGLASSPYLWNTSEEYSIDNSIIVNSNGEYNITVKDKYGYTYTSGNYNVTNIDKNAPEIEASVNPNGNKASLTVSDSESGLDKITVNKDETGETTISDYLESNTPVGVMDYDITSDGTYVFTVYDNAGNTTEKPVTISDGKPDNAELTSSGIQSAMSHTPTTWTNNPVLLRVSFITEEGLADTPYKWNEVNGFTNSKTATASINGSYCLTVKDVFGNEIVSDPYLINNIDTVVPEIVATPNTDSNVITISATDDLSGISKITQLVSGNDEDGYVETTLKDFYSTSPLNGSVDFSVPANGIYKFRVYDNAGNKKDESCTITSARISNEDYTSLGIYNQLSHYPTTWTNNPVTLQVMPTTMTGLATVPFKWSSEINDTTSKKTTIAANGTYTLTVYDMYGNTCTSDSYIIDNIDTVLPTINVVMNEHKNTATITVNDPVGDVENARASGLSKVTVATGGSGEITIKDYQISETISDTFEYTIPANGTYYFRVYDNAKNSSLYEQLIENAQSDSAILTADNLRDAITQSPETETWVKPKEDFDITQIGAVTLRMNIEDINELSSVPYNWNNKGFTNVKTCSVNANGNYTISVQDKYGTSHVSSEYTVSNIDDTAPTAEIVYDEINQITITAMDTQSGINRIVLEKDGQETVFRNLIQINGTNEVKCTYTVPSLGNYTYYAYDNVENKSEICTYEVTTAQIDNVNNLTPEALSNCVIQSPNNTTWTNTNVELALAMPNTVGLCETPYKWNVGDADYSTNNSVTITENGRYTVTVKDIYGNLYTSNEIDVSNIDNVAPVLGEITTVTNKFRIPVGEELNGSGLNKVTITKDSGIEETIKDYSNSETLIKDDIILYTIPSTGIYIINVYDNAGNVTTSSSIEVTSVYVDNTELNHINERITKSTEDPTKEAVRITLSLTDLTGLAAMPYKWSTDEVYTVNNYVDVNENGLYKVTIKDAYGNEYVSDDIQITNIDSTPPVITTFELSGDETELTISVEDSGSGLSRVLWEGGLLDELTSIKEFSSPAIASTFVASVPGNGTYTVSVYDVAGNKTTQEVVVENIDDSTNPLLNPSGIKNSVMITPGTWTNGNVLVYANLANKTGIAENGYKFETTCETDDIVGEWGNNNAITVKSNGTIYVSVKDSYETENSIHVSDEIVINNIDRKIPEIEISIDTNNQATIIVTDTEDSSNGASGIKNVSVINPDETMRTIQTMDGISTSAELYYQLTDTGTYKFIVTDNAGNESVYSIDKPSSTITNSGLTAETVTNSITLTPIEWTSGSVLATSLLTDITDLAERPYKFDNGEWQTDNFALYNNNAAITVSVKDANGNIYTSNPVAINNIDRIMPTLTTSVTKSTNTATIAINSSDAESGIKMVTIIGRDYAKETIISSYEASAPTSSDTISVSKNGTYTIVAYDVVGNKCSVNVIVNGIAETNQDQQIVTKVVENVVEKAVAPVVNYISKASTTLPTTPSILQPTYNSTNVGNTKTTSSGTNNTATSSSSKTNNSTVSLSDEDNSSQPAAKVTSVETTGVNGETPVMDIVTESVNGMAKNETMFNIVGEDENALSSAMQNGEMGNAENINDEENSENEKSSVGIFIIIILAVLCVGGIIIGVIYMIKNRDTTK